MNGVIRKAQSAMALFGVDAQRLRSSKNTGRFLRDRKAWLAQGGKIDTIKPILFDYEDSTGSAQGHYFHQDLLVSQFVFKANPSAHADVGSRIDGFCAHVAAFRPIDIIDIRPLEALSHPNMRFVQADLMKPLDGMSGRYPSVSCLHALEHFGLGRYTDPINVNGHRDGFEAIASLVAPAGILYISFPIGPARVEFNAQRVFDPAEVLSWSPSFTLERFDYVDDAGALHKDARPDDARSLTYGCGIYTLRKAPD